MSNDSLFSRVNDAAERGFGRNPSYTRVYGSALLWTPGAGVAAPNSGLALDDTTSCQVLLTPRFRSGGLTALVFLNTSTYDAATDYEVTVNGTAYNTTGEAAAYDALADLATQINADASDAIDPRATVLVDQTTTAFDSVDRRVLVITSWEDPATPADALLEVDFTATGGAGTAAISCVTDPADATYAIFLKPEESTGDAFERPWANPQNGSAIGPLTTNWGERIDCAGFSRVGVQVLATTARANQGASVGTLLMCYYGPAIPEDE